MSKNFTIHAAKDGVVGFREVKLAVSPAKLLDARKLLLSNLRDLQISWTIGTRYCAYLFCLHKVNRVNILKLRLD